MGPFFDFRFLICDFGLPELPEVVVQARRHVGMFPRRARADGEDEEGNTHRKDASALSFRLLEGAELVGE